MLSWARVLLLGPALLALSLVSFFSLLFFWGGGESVADGVPGACGSGTDGNVRLSSLSAGSSWLIFHRHGDYNSIIIFIIIVIIIPRSSRSSIPSHHHPCHHHQPHQRHRSPALRPPPALALSPSAATAVHSATQRHQIALCNYLFCSRRS